MRIRAGAASWGVLVLLAMSHDATAHDVRIVSGTITAGGDSVPVPIPIAVFAPLATSQSLLNRVCAETDAIWKPAGITFAWHRVTSSSAARPWWLSVTIDDGPETVSEGQGALGWIPFMADGPQRSIHLSRSNAEALLLRTPGVEDKTIFTHEALLGRALGRALSHELGHYLFRSKMHTLHGLMRAVRSSEEFFQSSRDGFVPNASERQAAALHVQHEEPHAGTTAAR